MPITRIRDIRRQELVEAAFKIIKREGLQSTTISKIAREAGASKGVVHHYFKNREQLIEKTMRYIHTLRKTELVEKLRGSRSASERLSAVLSVILDEKYLQQGFCNAWVSFSAEATRNKRFARLQKVIHSREQSNLIHAFRPFLEEREAKKAARRIKFLMEGFRFAGRLPIEQFRFQAGFKTAERDPTIPRAHIFSFIRQKVPGFDKMPFVG
jgi:TetR/AcrR family transcriptional regulator, transcriptional repressor of bet genes